MYLNSKILRNSTPITKWKKDEWALFLIPQRGFDWQTRRGNALNVEDKLGISNKEMFLLECKSGARRMAYLKWRSGRLGRHGTIGIVQGDRTSRMNSMTLKQFFGRRISPIMIDHFHFCIFQMTRANCKEGGDSSEPLILCPKSPIKTCKW